jgi:hypothetical protein
MKSNDTAILEFQEMVEQAHSLFCTLCAAGDLPCQDDVLVEDAIGDVDEPNGELWARMHLTHRSGAHNHFVERHSPGVEHLYELKDAAEVWQFCHITIEVQRNEGPIVLLSLEGPTQQKVQLHFLQACAAA